MKINEDRYNIMIYEVGYLYNMDWGTGMKVKVSHVLCANESIFLGLTVNTIRVVLSTLVGFIVH